MWFFSSSNHIFLHFKCSLVQVREELALRGEGVCRAEDTEAFSHSVKVCITDMEKKPKQWCCILSAMCGRWRNKEGTTTTENRRTGSTWCLLPEWVNCSLGWDALHAPVKVAPKWASRTAVTSQHILLLIPHAELRLVALAPTMAPKFESFQSEAQVKMLKSKHSPKSA